VDLPTQSVQSDSNPQSRDHLLLQKLIYSLEKRPPESLARLIAYHAKFPELQSTRTFNLLLEHAVRHRHHRHIFLLIRQMRSSRCHPNTVTLRLWIRFLVIEGQNLHAWSSLVHSTPKPLLDTIPLDVWKEFFRLKRVTDHRLTRKKPDQTEHDLTTVPLLLHFIDAALRRNPNSKVNLHFSRLLVARLVSMGQISYAEFIANRLLEGAPPDIPHRNSELLLDLVHQFLAYGPVNTTSHFEMRRMLDRMLELRPTLCFDAHTLHLLLRSLYRTKNSGWQAVKLLKTWLERWGPASEDNLVRRRIATYAIRDGRDDIALVMYMRVKAGVQSPKNPNESEVQHFDISLERQTMRKIYPGDGKLQRLWLNTLIKCAEVQASRDSRLTSIDIQKSMRRISRILENASATWTKRHQNG
jgi:pentatricopeptide repeat protein